MAALLAGLFLGLATLPPPVAVTGPVGRAIGAFLRDTFGVGAATIPLVPLFWAIALFGHFERATTTFPQPLMAAKSPLVTTLKIVSGVSRLFVRLTVLTALVVPIT